MLATADDVKAALRAMGRPELAEALPPVDDLLQEASDLVTGHLWPSEVPTPTPGPICRVVATMAATVLTRPREILPETASLQADGFGVTFTPGGNSPGPYLTAALKARLRPYRSGVSSVAMGSERY
ncbi:head-to-tail adaptor [Mycobacterium phage SirPhilip]|uniref:Head-to-tail adaptor n=1 Tax=Mycobacterium phage SirPhilip TaxID=2015824 RepID=A0A222ZLD7_9CAUD|nr:head-to-tail adaptor [Mycobacterium phage SirPhilip]ASR85215.1 head-to-tail adaptor [Mycobacterium phage SirPhilip]